jgi:hypothetical protein
MTFNEKLDEQIKKAEQEISTWPQWIKKTTQLEGSSLTVTNQLILEQRTQKELSCPMNQTV